MSPLRRILTSSTQLAPRLILRPSTTTPILLSRSSRLNTNLNSTTPYRSVTMSHLPQLDGLQIEEQVHKADASRRTKRGDHIYVHYTGTLTDGSKFDSSRDRNQPLDFTVGSGQVITGWDEGLLGMAEGEKRKLTIAPQLGYGARGMPPVIPPSATLIFETELVKIK